MVMKKDTVVAIRFFLRYLTDNVPHRGTKTIVILNGKILITMDLIRGEIFLEIEVKSLSFIWRLGLTSFKFSPRSTCNFTINSHLILHYPAKRETNSFSVEVSCGIINKFIELWLIPSTRHIINNYCLVQWYNIVNRKCSFVRRSLAVQWTHDTG